jgi:helix-turn-helix protein
MFYGETKEGGCTTTVHADEPGELHGVHETDATYKLSNKQDKRISINELSKVTDRTSENLNGKLI